MHKQNIHVKKNVQGWFRLFFSYFTHQSESCVRALTVYIWLQNQAWTAEHFTWKKKASKLWQTIRQTWEMCSDTFVNNLKKKQTSIQWNMFAWGLNAPWTDITDTADSHLAQNLPPPAHLNFEEKVYAHSINCHPLRTKMAPRYDLRDWWCLSSTDGKCQSYNFNSLEFLEETAFLAVTLIWKCQGLEG